jgi:hypothetical protein
VSRGDVGGDSESAPALAAARPRTAREIGDGSRQAGAVVAHLDANPARIGAGPQLDPAPAVLDGVGQQIPARLREAQAVASHQRPARRSIEMQRRTGPGRRGAPGRHGGADQRPDVDRLGAVARAAARPRGMQVLQRQAGAAQFDVDRGDPRPGRSGGERQQVQAEARRMQRATGLVARPGDHLGAPGEFTLEQGRGGERPGGEQPPHPGRGGHQAASSRSTPGSRSRTSPSTKR